ncbi:MAG TPA: response regulator, partial [Tepidisphaeraceae bacterium]|nr:response regulator [Tepidisphaeraceae bacterium]
EALSQANSHAPAAIVLDLMLPDMSGFDVCSRLKASTATTSVPIIILTALDSAEARKKGLECGAAEYLTKPFDPDVLIRLLARYAPSDPHPA